MQLLLRKKKLLFLEAKNSTVYPIAPSHMDASDYG